MLEIPGKACGPCSFCCKVLEIDELKKTAGDLCEHCARSGTLLMDDPDSDEYHAVCDPEKPFSWRNPLIFRHLVSLAKEGRVVVAKAGLRSWRIFADGRSQESA
jgi:hypothetical protein